MADFPLRPASILLGVSRGLVGFGGSANGDLVRQAVAKWDDCEGLFELCAWAKDMQIQPG
jgi:hypothetical protein